jgi:hypothetical protein
MTVTSTVRSVRAVARVGGVELAVAVDVEHGDLGVVPPLQVAAGGKDGGMLGGLGDHLRPMAGPPGGVGVQGGRHAAADRQRVGLRPAAGEHDPPIVACDGGLAGAEQGGDLGPGAVQTGPGRRTVGVGAGGVAEGLGQGGAHSLGDAGVDRGGGVVVQVDRPAVERRMRRDQGLQSGWRVGDRAGRGHATS